MYSPGFTALSMQLRVLAYHTKKSKNKQKVYFIVVIFMDFCSLIPYIFKVLLIFVVFLLLHKVSAEQVSIVRSDVNYWSYWSPISQMAFQ